MRERNTIQKALVLSAVRSIGGHVTAEEVYDFLRPANPSISKATIYRNLRQLADKGDLLRVTSADSPERYDPGANPHYHAQCRQCLRLFDVDMDYIGDINGMIRDKKGFTFDGHAIIFFGTCPDCAENAAP